MKYTVEITESALETIHAQARYIAIDCQSPLNAGRWLEQIWDAIDALAQSPTRHNLAPENDFKFYEVRRVLVGQYLILFTVSDETHTVWVIGFRHGSRLPRPTELPDVVPHPPEST
ncbi:MAG TPA: type II toxin-antitoxin system RelE/ParE family toxin [Tepidisphaeraceae bacterium]|jgi:plasmid stabilization system protein ParE